VKKFRFRYERLLSLARQERRQAALSLALALTAAEEAAAHREAAVGSLREARRQNHLRLREGAPGWLVAAQGPYQAHLQDLVRAAAAREQTAQEEVDRCRLLYQERYRQEEVYRRLRRRAWERFYQEARRREQLQLEEVYRWRGNGFSIA